MRNDFGYRRHDHDGLTEAEIESFAGRGGTLLAYFAVILAVLVIGLAITASVFAATPACPWDAACLSWTAPTQYTDGTTLPATSIASYSIEAAGATAGPWTAVATVPATQTTYQRRPVSGSQWYRVSTVLVSGVTSAPAPAGPDVTVEPAPNAPIVTVAGTGYRLDLGYLNQIKTAAIGIVPLNTPCKPEGANGLNLVDRAKLKLDPGKTLPKQVLAKCEPVG